MWVYLPFLQTMAGLGAPDILQLKTADVPSVTVMSEGGVMKDGDTPTMKGRNYSSRKLKNICTNNQPKQKKLNPMRVSHLAWLIDKMLNVL